MKKKNSSYNFEASLFSQPLRVDEVETLALTLGDLKADEVKHLLNRILVTFREQRRRINELQSDVENISAQNSLVNHPVQMAIDILNGLKTSELETVLDARYIQSLKELDNEKEAFENQKLLLYSEINRIKFILASINQDPSIPSSIKDSLNAIVEKYTNS